MQEIEKANLLRRISDFFYNKSNFRISIACTAIFVAYLLLVMTRQAISFEVAESNLKSLGMTFGFDDAAVIAFFQGRTETMIAAYMQFNLIWDNIFAVIYGTMYVVWLSVLLKASEKRFGIINLIPFLQVAFDFLENLSIVHIADQYLMTGAIPSYFVRTASFFVMMKWICSGITYFALIFGVGVFFVKLLKKK
jgi:hypothetical protein